MYWNDAFKAYKDEPVLININMRCIEIAYGYPIVGCASFRLTLTWDVLKYYNT